MPFSTSNNFECETRSNALGVDEAHVEIDIIFSIF